MTTLTILRERLSAATGPDRELDAALMLALRECDPEAWYDAVEDCLIWHEWRDVGDTQMPERCGQGLPCLTASADASLALVERKLPGCTHAMDATYPEAGIDWSIFYDGKEATGTRAPADGQSIASAIAFAILLALTAALEAKETTHE